MKINSAQRLSAANNGKWEGSSTISFIAHGDSRYMIPKLLRVLAYLGSAGASRTITIEDVPASDQLNLKEGDIRFGFDGDGADKIEDITVDGKPYELEEAFEVQSAATPDIKEDGLNISAGGNSFKFSHPAEAYKKAAEFIDRLMHDGYKFNARGAMSSKMDVFTKGGTEISISVRNSILNVDLW
jgi:hypothetical protein